MHAKKIRFLIITFILFTWGLKLLDADNTSEDKVLVRGSGVKIQDFFALQVGSRLEDLLNEAKCHRCTAQRRISVRRLIDGESFNLRVSNHPESRDVDLETYEPKNGDIVVVPCRMFSMDDHNIPVTVSGPFYVISRERVEVE